MMEGSTGSNSWNTSPSRRPTVREAAAGDGSPRRGFPVLRGTAATTCCPRSELGMFTVWVGGNEKESPAHAVVKDVCDLPDVLHGFPPMSGGTAARPEGRPETGRPGKGEGRNDGRETETEAIGGAGPGRRRARRTRREPPRRPAGHGREDRASGNEAPGTPKRRNRSRRLPRRARRGNTTRRPPKPRRGRRKRHRGEEDRERAGRRGRPKGRRRSRRRGKKKPGDAPALEPAEGLA